MNINYRILAVVTLAALPNDFGKAASAADLHMADAIAVRDNAFKISDSVKRAEALKDAAKAFEEVSNSDKEISVQVEAKLNAAVCFNLAEDTKSAAFEYNAASILSQKDDQIHARVLSEEAAFLYGHRDFENAVLQYKNALKLAKGHAFIAKTKIELASCLNTWAMSLHGDASDQLESVTTLSKDQPQEVIRAYGELMKLYSQFGMRSRSAQYLEKAKAFVASVKVDETLKRQLESHLTMLEKNYASSAGGGENSGQ